jgi:hypothetical protein
VKKPRCICRQSLQEVWRCFIELKKYHQDPKAKYDAVTTASATMGKAMKAFTGNTDLNSDADQAIQKIRQDVANKIGGIKSAIQITSQAMVAQDLKDAAKVSIAAQTAHQLDVDKTFSYSDSVTSSAGRIETPRPAARQTSILTS